MYWTEAESRRGSIRQRTEGTDDKSAAKQVVQSALALAAMTLLALECSIARAPRNIPEQYTEVDYLVEPRKVEGIKGPRSINILSALQ